MAVSSSVTGLFALAMGVAACCPPPEPVTPGPGACPAPAPSPPGPTAHRAPATSTRAMPAPVLSRFQQPASPSNTPTPERESITEPPNGLPLPKTGEVPVTREPLVPPRPPSPTATLPDDVVLQLLETGRAAFVRCFKKALADDPSEISFKVKLHVELDANGTITASSTDATNVKLDQCLVHMAAWLKFPASGQPVRVELPLFYRAE